jgi:3-hydroxyisobutyrate dehydrogenase
MTGGCEVTMTIGFIGLGVMGTPMALNLVHAGTEVVVWNRSASATDPFRALGVPVAETVAEVFARTRVVFLMLVNEGAIDSVLARGTPAFAALLSGHTIVNMSSVPPEYARRLDADVRGAGGRYVEAPVSGSRKPAELGQLVALLGGDSADIDEVRPLLAPMCHECVVCGAVPSGLLMKLAVNVFMLSTVSGLAEAFHFADRQGLPAEQLLAAVNAGPMASAVSRVKGAKLASRDFAVQALTSDGYRSTQLITDVARATGAATPLMDQIHALYGEAVALGHGAADMISVLLAIEARADGSAAKHTKGR